MSGTQPMVSIDVVPLRFNRELGQLEFATGARLFEPFIGEQALPGVLLNGGESIEDSAERALREKTGLPKGRLLQIGSFDSTNRDPRGATISIAFVSAQSDDVSSASAVWHSTPPALPFDHNSIVSAAFERVAQALWSDVHLTRVLLGERFTTADAVALGSPVPNVSNVSRWLRAWPEVRKLDEIEVKTGGASAGRPASTWGWSDS